MIISAVSKEYLILQNIVNTLSQIRIGGKLPSPLIIDTLESNIEVIFYTDVTKTTVLFSDSDPANFSTFGDKTLYQVQDININFTNDSLSQLYCQKTYWVDVVIDEYAIVPMNYDNSVNLLFQSVIVSTKKDPVFTTNDNSAIIVPVSSDESPNDYAFHSHIFPEFHTYLQITTPELLNLSEQNRMLTAYSVTNILRLALYKDPYRGGQCTFYDENLDGTWISQCNPRSSGDMFFSGVCKVKTCYMASETTF